MNNLLKTKYRQIKINNRCLYLIVCIDKYKSDNILLDKIASAISGGVDIIEISSENNPKRLFNIGQKIKLLCEEFDTTLIIKDRLDVAYLIEADGVSLGLNSLDTHSARQILGDNILIGSYDIVNNDCDFLILNQSETCTNIPVFIYSNEANFKKIAVSDTVMDSESPQDTADILKNSILNL